MTNLILDTTYVLPLFGFDVNGINLTKPKILKLWDEGIGDYQIYLPTVCLLESLYRINMEIRKKMDESILKRYEITLPTIISSKKVKLFSSLTDIKVAEYALSIRQLGHQDLMDCLIAATAYALNGILVSEDDVLKRILENDMARKIPVVPLDKILRDIS